MHAHHTNDPGRAPARVDLVRELDTGTPSPARMYDHMLGGQDNFQVDRDAVAEVELSLPTARSLVRANRDFLGRVVRYLADECGIRQFLDLGSGLPTQGNVHEIAQEIAPDSRVVYIDHDEMVLSHGRAILAANEDTAVSAGDLRDPDSILRQPELLQLIDPSQPVAVLLIAVLHFIRDEEKPADIVRAFRSWLAPGSYLALSHVDRTPRVVSAARVYDRASAPAVPRSHGEVRRFFDGFKLVGPGLVQVPAWRPAGGIVRRVDVPWWGGVGLKPRPEAADV